MIIGIPAEIMDKEFRVAMTPAGVHALVTSGHRVLIQQGAGLGSGIDDRHFAGAGAEIMAGADQVFAAADMIIKVKEPLAAEWENFRADQILFTFLHLAPRPELTDFLCQRKIRAVAYETIQLEDGSLPVLAPMSEVAGRLAVQVGAHCLEKPNGGAGVLLGGVPGVEPGRITVIGAGKVGSSAVRIGQALGADLTVIDISLPKLEHLDELYGGRIKTIMSSEHVIRRAVTDSDLVIGAVLRPGGRSPILVTRDMVAAMRPGSVIVDVAIDQGGCVETARVTTHSHPIYTVDGVIHYGVANMPGIVPRTSTHALVNVSLPYVLEIAEKGLEQAAEENMALLKGINVYDGAITNRQVAEAQGKSWQDLF